MILTQFLLFMVFLYLIFFVSYWQVICKVSNRRLPIYVYPSMRKTLETHKQRMKIKNLSDITVSEKVLTQLKKNFKSKKTVFHTAS